MYKAGSDRNKLKAKGIEVLTLKCSGLVKAFWQSLHTKRRGRSAAGEDTAAMMQTYLTVKLVQIPSILCSGPLGKRSSAFVGRADRADE